MIVGCALATLIRALYCAGAKKGFKFHDKGWESSLRTRADCDVVRVPAGHWLMTECPELVNEKMEAWLSQILPGLADQASAVAKL